MNRVKFKRCFYALRQITIQLSAAILLTPSVASAKPLNSVSMVSRWIFDDGDIFVATALNNAGAIVGVSNGSSPDRLAVYKDGVKTRISIPGEIQQPTGINDRGQIVGYASYPDANPGNPYRAFLYADGVFNDLGTLGGTLSSAAAINKSGVITGSSTLLGDAVSHGFIYMNGAMTDIGTIEPVDINDSGEVVGWGRGVDGASRVLMYKDGIVNQLGIPGSFAITFGINNAGQVIGVHDSPNGNAAFVYQNGVTTDLGFLDGDNNSWATAINNNGEIIGQSGHDGGGHSWLYSDHTLYNLDTLVDPSQGWRIFSAIDINDQGQILTTACNSTNTSCGALLLTREQSDAAVPEPGSLTTLLGGLAGMAWLRKRRPKQNQEQRKKTL